MPTAVEILAGAARIARENVIFAVLWHAAIAAVLIRMLYRPPPARRVAGIALALPLASVSVFSWAYGNPFNGALFAVLAVVVAGLGAWLPRTRVERGATWERSVGWVMLVYALVYPHFLEEGAGLTYLVAAPVGLIPCPTLALVVGFALLGGGLRARAWSAVIAAAALFYAILGIVRLGVWLDVGLLAGGVALAAVATRQGHTARRPGTERIIRA